MRSANYDVKCLSCATEAGQIILGRFVPRPGGRASAADKIGMLRCSHCGGSLLLEPTDVYAFDSRPYQLGYGIGVGAGVAVRPPPSSRLEPNSPGETA